LDRTANRASPQGNASRAAGQLYRYPTDDIVFEVLDVYAAFRRGNVECHAIQSQITSMGGDVIEHRRISRIVKSPFPGLRIYSNLHEFRTNHGTRRGYWFVRTSSDGHPHEWAWFDLDGYESLPILDLDAYITSDVKTVGLVEDTVIVGGLIVVGVVGCVVVALLLT
jgi:hypothetical protein